MSDCSTYMTKQDILDTIKDLSRSQGLYQRLWDSIQHTKEDYPESYEQYMEHLQQQHFKDPVDLVMYFEC